MHIEPVFLIDLDGTLVDSVYQHVLACKAALDCEGIEFAVWRIHREIGMSGGLFTHQLLRETGFEIDPVRIERLRRADAENYKRAGVRHPPLAGCARAACGAHTRQDSLGDRDLWADGDGGV